MAAERRRQPIRLLHGTKQQQREALEHELGIGLGTGVFAEGLVHEHQRLFRRQLQRLRDDALEIGEPLGQRLDHEVTARRVMNLAVRHLGWQEQHRGAVAHQRLGAPERFFVASRHDVAEVRLLVFVIG